MNVFFLYFVSAHLGAIRPAAAILGTTCRRLLFGVEIVELAAAAAGGFLVVDPPPLDLRPCSLVLAILNFFHCQLIIIKILF
jgi:hypothetical protein